MPLLHVTVVGTHVDHTRQSSTIAGRKATLVEIDVFHHIGVKRGEKSHGVINLVERRTIEQNKILIVITTMNVETRC